MNNDSSNQVCLTNNLGADNFPVWSSDGRRIRDSSAFVIKIVNVVKVNL
ncbi:MAG: hypothetical protein LC778_12140 [Acidobacteria bacterium]|nr:hypothetical protein [Acidobacteriota bacterium]